MFAVMNELLYRYNEFMGNAKLFTFDNSKVDDSFSLNSNGCYVKEITSKDSSLTDIYDIDFLVSYEDAYIRDEKMWYILEDNRSDRPYSIDKDEICLNVFGSCDEGGWKSLGREDSYKIISLSDCSAFFVDYVYEKKEGEILDKQITQRCEVSKEEFVGLIKQHRVKNI
ncbi:hypothetical protein [Butyrivibrio sp. XBB1001]|uniref:hypothetical protein n=1 Tax=Butyrivibrio sp. XBB1001 TaxID=1280682 RepID=UPI00041656ED|nr:hypothetical protein [Butyrivibrio sp. XBB1001]